MKRIEISGVIGWDATPEMLREQLNEANGNPVELVVSSPGGFVAPGIEMFNLIRNYEGETTARLAGFAMSMASYIPLAADRVVAEDNAVYMIHNARGGVLGDHNDILKYGNFVKALSNLLASAYFKKTEMSADEIRQLMDEETYYFGQEMVDAGFVDELIETDSDSNDDSAKAAAVVAFKDCQERMAKDHEAVKEDIDRVAALADVSGINHKPRAQAKAEPATKGVKAMTLEKMKSEHPDLVAAIVAEAKDGMLTQSDVDDLIATATAEGKADGMKEGAEQERARIQAVEGQSMPGHEALIAELKFDGETTGEQAAVKVLAAEKASQKGTAAAIAADTPPVVPHAEPTGNGPEPTGSLEEQAKAKWEKDGDLRAEFGDNFAAFLAFEKNTAKGSARIFKQ